MKTRYADYINAGEPALAVETVEEERFLIDLLGQFASDRKFLEVSSSGKLSRLSLRPGDGIERTVVDAKAGYVGAVEAVAGDNATARNTVLVMHDFHHIVRNPQPYRGLKDRFNDLKRNRSCVVMLAPAWQLPPELQHDVSVVDLELPAREQLGRSLEVAVNATNPPQVVAKAERESLLDAASGLTLQEAEKAFALCLAVQGKFSPAIVQEAKMKIVRTTGYLEVAQPLPLDRLGGMGRLKGFVRDEMLPSLADDDLRVKGVLLNGAPGTGKTLAAKVIASMLGWPFLRADIPAMKGSLVGQSEANVRHFTRTVDALQKVVVLMDEVEKATAGHESSGQTDSGTTSGMIGTILTWMSERTSPAILVMTCNNMAKLPPPLARAGRIDERFYVDLPGQGERLAIAGVHLERFGCDAKHAELLSSLSAGWTGAEIEQAVKSAARRTGRKLTGDAVRAAAEDVKPYSVLHAADLNDERERAKATMRFANDDESETQPAGRKVKGVAR